MKALRWASLCLVLADLAIAANTAEVPIPPAPTAWVTDTAGFLTPQTVDSLDARLRAYQATSGHQILVYVAPTTGASPTEDWTVRAFARWKVGRKGIDDGLVMFVFPTDHKVRIEVGYGLEQTVPDAIASRIIRNTVVPKIQAGQPDQAVISGVDQLLAVIGGETATAAPAVATAAPAVVTAAPDYSDTDSDQSPVFVAIGVLIGLLIIVGFLWLMSKLPDVPGPYISGGNSGSGLWSALAIGGSLLGGFSGGGGGFSGGGGAGGGGGATGSW